MVNKERLYEAFGEIIYVVAMADGIVQKEELEQLEKMLANHPWAKIIKWSFDYELEKKNDPKNIYKKALYTLVEHGPDKEYELLFNLLEEIAKASDGLDREEAEVLIDFDMDLRSQFLRDLEKNNLLLQDDLD